ncbi:hypothetical protein ACWD3J_30450 [Streptomyces sp. NPDC002755]|uniref:hypothetical protein n=1 Tax=Streptomyces sp. NPDC002884 TaxID=3154544 RepID=UPI003328C1F8
MPNDRPRKYIKAVRAATKMQPSWPPSEHRELGDVGVFRDGQFERKGTMQSLFGVEVIPRDAPDNNSSYHCDSNGSVQLLSHAAAGVTVAPAADASVVLEFGRADAVLFRATGCRTEEIKNIEAVEARMLELHAQKKWPRDYVVVTEVTHASRTTALMSKNRKDRIELRASADPGISGLDLLTASGGLSWAGGSVAGLQLLSEGELTPLYRVRGMVRHLFRDDEPSYLGPDETEDEQDESDTEWYVDEVSSAAFDAEEENDAE